MSHFFVALVLLTSVTSETSILPKYNIFVSFIIYIGIHLRKLVDNVCNIMFMNNSSNNYCNGRISVILSRGNLFIFHPNHQNF